MPATVNPARPKENRMTSTTVRDLLGWIDDAADKLHHAPYDDYILSLAAEITERLTTDEQRKAVLRHLIEVQLMSWPLAGGALDECADESYTLLSERAARIADLAWQQMQAEKSDLPLRVMVVDSIHDTEQ